jgi:uncharacterized protein (TIGR02246 family)
MINSTMTNEQRATIEQTVRTMMDDGFDAARDVDIDRILATSSDEGNLGFANNGFFFPSLAAIGEAFREGFARLEKQDITVKETRVAVLAPNVASAVVTSDFTAYNKDGTTSSSSAVLTFIYVKEGENWKSIHTHQSLPWPKAE